jgi:hypothetical protein
MDQARVSGKNLILTGGFLVFIIASGATIFARFYLRDSRNPPPVTTQPVSHSWP